MATIKKLPAETARVEAVERALGILEAFEMGPSRMTLTELANRTSLYPSTILRLSASLIRFGYLHRDETGLFRLGPSLWRLGSKYARAFNLAEKVRPVLSRLGAEAKETAAFYVQDQKKRVCLFRINAARGIGDIVEEGAEFPMDTSASGMVLAAFAGGKEDIYARIRRAGYHASPGELDPESFAVAAPVLGMNNRFVGALSVTGPRMHFDKVSIKRFAKLTMAAARDLSAQLGATEQSMAEAHA